MATFPDITAPSYGLEEETYRPQIRTEFENGAVQSRPRFTGTKKRWPNLSWAVLEESEFQTLEAFFIANQGLTFTWTHPVTSAVYTCRFSKDILKSSFVNNLPGYRRVECPIEEA